MHEDKVIPLRTEPVLVEPGQSVHDAEWLAGWAAAMHDIEKAVDRAYALGYATGYSARGRAGEPVVAVFVTFAFIVGFVLAVAVFA